MDTDENNEVKQFYESIIPVIEKMSTNNRYVIGGLIKKTKIIAGHDAIITAWETKMAQLQVADFGVAESVSRQKKSEPAA